MAIVFVEIFGLNLLSNEDYEPRRRCSQKGPAVRPMRPLKNCERIPTSLNLWLFAFKNITNVKIQIFRHLVSHRFKSLPIIRLNINFSNIFCLLLILYSNIQYLWCESFFVPQVCKQILLNTCSYESLLNLNFC